MATNIKELEALIAQIQGNSTKLEELTISSPMVNSETDLNVLCDVIHNNSTLKTVTVSNIYIHPCQAQQLFYAFLSSRSLSVLHMPLYGVVDTPSQKTLMRLDEDFDTSLQVYNTVREQEINNVIGLAIGMRKGFKSSKAILSEYSMFKRQKIEVDHVVNIPPPALQLIKDCCASVRKKITL